MTVIELKKRLIGKINSTDNNEILEEMYRLIENEETDLSVYKLSSEQNSAIEEAQDQYRKGKIMTNEQADKEIDEWLGE
jgi:CRISPR/Cas system-associated endoribonuclease Cas2